ncbi:MAG: hypothetical protein FJ095_17685 [Deltaproteobacteria bacterium]|nr:hypothetical protein [Deltaproteobacteria bacterium]
MRAALLVTALSLTGCGGAGLAADVRESASPARLPKVLGCYEEAFESAGFVGEYDATVELEAEAATGAIRNARVAALEGRGGKVPQTFEGCLVKALEASELRPRGEAPSSRLTVRGLHFSFRDGSSAARKDSSADRSPVLVGPRADRCQGLYGYTPPRAIADLYRELEDAQTKLASTKQEPDSMARSLQRAYDVALELRRRIELDGWQPDVPEESRRRFAKELAKVERSAIELGAQIGCTPSAE